MRLDEIRGFVRLARGLRPFLAGRVDAATAASRIRTGTEERGERFLAKISRVVFANPQSPYLAMCRWAGVELPDIVSMVRADGLEAALLRLRDAGVWVDWEELKGRRPIVRGSQSLHAHWRMFNNPLAGAAFEASTGGSSGRALRVAVDLDYLAESTPGWAVLFSAHGWEDRPLLFWTPDHVGMASRYLKCSRFGKDMDGWFVMARMTAPADRLRGRLVHGLCRLAAGYPPPVDAPLSQPGPVLERILHLCAEGRPPVVNTSPSAAALLARLALDRGHGLEGVAFLLGAEPVTPSRWQAMVAAGARPVATYGTSEAGWIGAQFPGAQDVDEVLLFRDAYAVIAARDGDAGHPRPLLFTNLLGSAPKVLLNAGIGDTARIEQVARPPWASDLGYTERLFAIRSLAKVTVWGVTLAVTDLETILEQELPAAVGGIPDHYQLVEDEREHGEPVLRLLVDPAAGPVEPDMLRARFLGAVARRAATYGYMAEEIRSTGSLVVERARPQRTERGKLLPVRTRGAGVGERHRSPAEVSR